MSVIYLLCFVSFAMITLFCHCFNAKWLIVELLPFLFQLSEEQKFRNKYPGKKPASTDFLRKRIQKGVSMFVKNVPLDFIFYGFARG